MATLPSPRWGLLDQILGAYSLTVTSIMLSNLIAITLHDWIPFAAPLRDNLLMMLLISPQPCAFF